MIARPTPARHKLILFFITLFVSIQSFAKDPPNSTWGQVKKNGKGTITVHWFESQPFIYKTGRQMRGIEYELMEGFKTYLKDVHQIDLQINWKEAKDFGDAYGLIRDKKENGTFGASAFSITPDRQREVSFSLPYMSDICVLISSENIPIVETQEEFNRVFSKLTAITIRQTTYEKDLERLKSSHNLTFKTRYIPSSQNILRTVEKMDSAFAFIDLPVYMMIFNDDPSVSVKRQNFYPIKREGYALIYPAGSDWGGPLNEYFSNPNFKSDLRKIIGKYFHLDLFYFVESLATQTNDEVVLLTKEKEIQYKDLIMKLEQIQQETRTRNFLIVMMAVVLVFLFIIIMLYKKRNEQKEKIEAQRKSIALKSEQLEKRNEHLVALDEEKNNLIKILAHDLRTPINHVQGLAQVFLLSNESLPDEQKMIIRQINDAALRLGKMITNLLDIDAIENNRVKIIIDDVKIGTLVQQVVTSFDKQAQRKNISLTYQANGEDFTIRGDSLFLIQVFENLISNALKFSERGKTVYVTVSNENGKAQVRVKDEGPGLTGEDLQSLFRKFQRLSARPTGGESSLGLGLSIVKKYVELMGGKVWAESVVNRGATFTVEFDKV